MILSSFASSVLCVAQTDGQFKVDSLLKKSREARQQNYALAELYADSAIQLISGTKHTKLIANSYFYKAYAQTKGGKGKLAEPNYLRAIDLYTKSKDSMELIDAYIQLGNNYRSLDQSEKATEYLYEALRVLQNYNDSALLGDAYLSVAIVHAIAKNYSEAEKYMLLAQEVYKNIHEEQTQILVLTNLGTLYNEAGKYKEALSITEKVENYYATNGPPEKHALALHNLGNQHYTIGDYDKSLQYNTKSLEIYEQLGSKLYSCSIELSMSRTYLQMGNFRKAEDLAQSALVLANELNSYHLISNAYDILYALQKEQKNFEKALEYRLKYDEARDSIFQEEKRSQLDEINTRYKTELKESELQELQAKNQLNELQLKRKQNQQYILWAAMGFLLIIALLLFNQFRIKLKTNRLLRDKNEIIQKNLDEKEVLLKEIHHRVKNNMQFISSLLNLQSRHVNDENTLRVLNDCKNRVNSMSMVHQRLYQEENLKGVYMPHFVNTLLESLNHSYRRDLNKLNAEVDVAKIYLDVDTAIPIGLILNELITNVFKYAFEKDKDGKIKVCLKDEGDTLLLQVEDNGKGLPENFDRRNLNSFGLQLVESLAHKLKASLEIEGVNGTRIPLNIKNYKTA